jgi:gamma-glutamyltranspeptidase
VRGDRIENEGDLSMQAGLIHKSLRSPALCIAPNLEAGAAVLHWGGNAFDAAVAAGFVEAVIAPHNCGIGGYAATGVGFLGGCREVVALDANAVAPRAATPTMFPVLASRNPDDYGLATETHKRGPLSVAIPGVLGGPDQGSEAARSARRDAGDLGGRVRPDRL